MSKKNISSKKVNIWPWVYMAPALLILGFFLVYPIVNTIYLSFLDAKSEVFVGFSNYVFALTTKPMLIAFRNNLLWLVIFTAFTVSLGLIFAVIFDRVRYEPIVKSIIFLPMAISFVGAGVIWKFIYAYRPAGEPQIGVLNAILNNFGIEPVGWLVNKSTNNFALIAVGIWIWVGFCMVILSAAYKGIPKELLEAARVDGANELQVFWRITIPSMAPTIGVVTTTMIINVLKVFDIVYVMTNGQFDTEVIANRMYKEMFQFHNFGRASAIAVILLLLIIPMMIINVRRFKRQEKM
ncbi:MAG: sugar ABC transporter permease [Actinomycetota bacterium]|nr:sugar ABC transporter permease [Actinomycetota bacterium]